MEIDAFFAKVEEESTSHVLLHFKSNKDPMRFFFSLYFWYYRGGSFFSLRGLIGLE